MQASNSKVDDTRLDFNRRLPELDGVRGLAILLVLLWHYLQNQLHPAAGSTLADLKQALVFTWSGVDLFFVLSGFLIAGILMDQRGSPHYFRAFYVRRVCRIFPLYYLNLLVFVLFLASPAGSDPLLAPLSGDHSVPLWSYLVFLQNLFMGEHNSAGYGWLSVTWSLAVEEQFYLFLPLLVWLVPGRRLPQVFLVVALLAILLRFSLPGLSAYINTPWRADALMSGALLAWLMRTPGFLRIAGNNSGILTILWVLLVSLLLAAGNYGLLRLGGALTHAALALVYTLLVLLVLTDRAGTLAWLMRNRVLIWLGGISYGVYLIHTWMSRLVHGWVRNAQPEIASWQDAGVTLLALLLTLLLAVLSYHWMERRFIRIGHRIAYRDGVTATPGEPGRP